MMAGVTDSQRFLSQVVDGKIINTCQGITNYFETLPVYTIL